MARHDSGSVGRSRYASRALAFGLAPFFLFDQSESLPREAARLPGFDCSADRRCSEVDRDAEHSTRPSRREKRIAESVAREFLPAA